MTSFTVNGQPVHYRMDPATPLLWALRDASNLTGTQIRLRHRPLRGVHRPCRRHCGAQLPGADLGARGQLRHHHRGPVARPCPPDSAGLRRRHGGPVRLLHSGRDHGRRGADRPQRQPDRRPDRCRDHQHLPLRHLSAPEGRDPPRDPDQGGARAGRRGAAAGDQRRRGGACGAVASGPARPRRAPHP